MSEERKLILQMVAEGKITPDDADKLLQALEETERVARDAATEQVEQQQAAGGGRTAAPSLGESIETAVRESLKGLEAALGQMEFKLEGKLNDPARKHLRHSIEERIRQSVERSMEQAHRAEERAARAAERAAERAREQAERVAERAAHRAEQLARRIERLDGEGPVRIFKAGIAIDKVSVVRNETLTMPAQPGDCLVLDNRVGDIRVECYDGSDIEVNVRMEAWGEDEADANVRADGSKLRLVREGSDVVVATPRPPVISVVGIVSIKQTRMDFQIRVPHGMRLNLNNKAGDTVVVGARQVTDWQLTSKVGNIDVQVTREAGFAFDLQSEMGNGVVKIDEQPVTINPQESKRGFIYRGTVGHVAGRLEAVTKTGDIRLTN